MASVGAYLRDLRARQGVSLDEVARTTRVAHRYLAALEADAFDSLPAPVFTRGFIRAYCQALGEPPDEALACYDGRDGRVPPAAPSPAVPPRPAGGESRARGAILVSFLLLVVLGMALFTVTLVLQPGDRGERTVAEVRPDAPPPQPSSPAQPVPPDPVTSAPVPSQPAPSAVPTPATSPSWPPRSAVPAPPPAVTARPAPPASPPPPAVPAPPPAVASRPVSPAGPPAPAVPTPPPATATANTPPASLLAPPVPNLQTVVGGVVSPYRLVARTREATWIRVRTEDGRSSEETVPAGEVREWLSDRPFVVTLGNAGGVSLELNGRTLPSLGGPGAVVPRLVLPPP